MTEDGLEPPLVEEGRVGVGVVLRVGGKGVAAPW